MIRGERKGRACLVSRGFHREGCDRDDAMRQAWLVLHLSGVTPTKPLVQALRAEHAAMWQRETWEMDETQVRRWAATQAKETR